MHNAVQLFTRRVSIADLLQLETHCLPRLHSAEQARYQSFISAHRRLEWLAGRALVLHTLATVLDDLNAAALRTDARGKIVYRDAPVSLSLSHSHGMLVLAIASTAIGADVEFVRPRALISRAARVFAPEESARLAQARDSERGRLFYRYWTLKEAICKAAGVSLWTGLAAAQFDLRSAPAFVGTTEKWGAPWQFWCAELEADWQLAVAVFGAHGVLTLSATCMDSFGECAAQELPGLASF